MQNAGNVIGMIYAVGVIVLVLGFLLPIVHYAFRQASRY